MSRLKMSVLSRKAKNHNHPHQKQGVGSQFHPFTKRQITKSLLSIKLLHHFVIQTSKPLIMSEKIQWDNKTKGEYSHDKHPNDAPPPPYEDIQSQQNPYDRPALQPPVTTFTGGAHPANYSRPQQPIDPLQDPNVYKIKPDKVNITLSPPEHLNPQYQQYVANEPERFKRGDFPTNHNAPLNRGHVNPNNKSNKGFPGRSGATYHNAANK